MRTMFAVGRQRRSVATVVIRARRPVARRGAQIEEAGRSEASATGRAATASVRSISVRRSNGVHGRPEPRPGTGNLPGGRPSTVH